MFKTGMSGLVSRRRRDVGHGGLPEKGADVTWAKAKKRYLDFFF
jgi:hypothetical protein